MPENADFTIRQMRPDDLDQAFGLSIKEGWNQTLKDWKLLLDKPDNVCIVAEKDHRVVGTATALNHENKIAWIGMVLVDKELRGQGAGKMLLEHIIDNVKHVGSVKLDATPAGEPLYRKLGFIDEYKILRMTCDSLSYPSEISSSDEIFNIDQECFSEVKSLDRIIFGADRSYLLMKLLTENPGRSFYLKEDNAVVGYIFGRAGSRFNYIGPVCALKQDSARRLLIKAFESLGRQSVAIDIPEDKVDLINWLGSIGFEKQRHFIRMYLSGNPYPGKVKDQYLISGPEFG